MFSLRDTRYIKSGNEINSSTGMYFIGVVNRKLSNKPMTVQEQNFCSVGKIKAKNKISRKGELYSIIKYQINFEILNNRLKNK